MQLKFNDMNIFAKLDSHENEHDGKKLLPWLFMLDIFIYIS